MDPTPDISRYLELEKQKNLIEMEQQTIKSVMLTELLNTNSKVLRGETGVAELRDFDSPVFKKEKAKCFLTEEQYNSCIEITHKRYAMITSNENLERRSKK